jgi:hypothetical protein
MTCSTQDTLVAVPKSKSSLTGQKVITNTPVCDKSRHQHFDQKI